MYSVVITPAMPPERRLTLVSEFHHPRGEAYREHGMQTVMVAVIPSACP